jgi:ADP-heptose:LPS heptosyltransferase
MPFMKSLLQRTAGALMSVERLLRDTDTIDPASVNSVLILEYCVPLGCCVHLTPLYAAIKHCRPNITITVATHGLAYNLLRHNPHIDHLIPIPDPIQHLLPAVRVLSAELSRRNLHPDCTLTGVSDQRTRNTLLSFILGKGWRGGYTQLPTLYHRTLTDNHTISLLANNLNLLPLLGCSVTHFEPRAFFSPADIAAATQLIRIAGPQDRPLLTVVTQNSGGQRTGWHTDRFAQVIRHAHTNLGCNILYAGTSADTAAVESIRTAADNIGISITGKTSVTELAALLALSDHVFTLDTGTMHIGRAVEVPMVVIGPSWQKPIIWLPLDRPNVTILRGPDTDSATIPANYQLDEVQVEDAITALNRLIAAYPPDPGQRAARLAHSTSTTDHAAPIYSSHR